MANERYLNVKKTNFTMVQNELLNDKALTLQAKGLLSILISNDTDKFKVNMKEIITRSKNGRDAHYKVMDELIKHGYVARLEFREGGKFVEIVYLFSDKKEEVAEALQQFNKDSNVIVNPNKKKDSVDSVDKSPLPENQDMVANIEKPFPENPDTEKPDTEKSDTENQYNNNTNLNNTNLNNTNSNNINLSVDDELNDISNDVMPLIVKKQISVNQKRLMDDNISVYEILAFYKSTDNTLHDNDFAMVLSNVLKKSKGKIGSFHSVMKTAIKNWYDEYQLKDTVVDSEEPEERYYADVESDHPVFYNWLENR